MEIKAYLEHTDQLFDTYRKLNLQSIDDLNKEEDEPWDNKNFFSYFIDITRSTEPINPFTISDFKIYDDFVLLSGDIKFCAGMLHYLYPHISTDASFLTSTILDRRYIMHVNFGYQSIYQFWDRIGDLLWHFFETGLPEDKVYTGRVLNNIPNVYKETKAFISLKELFDQYKESFDIRHDVVHKFTLGTELYWERNAAFEDVQRKQEVLDKIIGYGDVITESLPNCITALQMALKFISKISQVKENIFRQS